MRVLFLGTPGRFTARALWGCLDAGHEICEFWCGHRITHRDWRDDRHLGWFNPDWSVSAALHRHQIPVRRVPPLRKAPSWWQHAMELNADLVVSAAFPYVVPDAMLQRFPGRALNLHPALLPNYRGPHPILGMLHHEDVARCGGVTLHEMVEDLDAGPIVAQHAVPWNPLGFRHWEADLCQATYCLATEQLSLFLQGAIPPRPQQPQGEVYFRTMNPELLQINHRRTAQRARHLLDSIGSYLALRAHAEDRSWKVSKFLDVISDQPTGRPPRVGPLRIEMDVADARVALQRWLPGTSKIRRWQTFRLFARIA